MKRRAFNVLAAVSLVMVIAVAALWARSVWWKSDFLVVPLDTFSWMACSKGGTIKLVYYNFGLEFDADWFCLDPYPTVWQIFDYYRIHKSAPPHEWTDEIIVADWLLILIFSAPPAAWLVMRLLRRKPVGLCAKCGYDLRGSPGPACPECGTAIPTKSGGNSN